MESETPEIPEKTLEQKSDDLEALLYRCKEMLKECGAVDGLLLVTINGSDTTGRLTVFWGATPSLVGLAEITRARLIAEDFATNKDADD